MSLPPDDPRLTAYALGELTPSARAAVEAEMEKSPDLQHELVAIESAARSIKTALKAEAKVDLTAAQRAAIFTRAQSTPLPSTKRVVPLPWIGYLAIAAGIAIMAILLGFWWSPSPSPFPVLVDNHSAVESTPPGSVHPTAPKEESEAASIPHPVNSVLAVSSTNPSALAQQPNEIPSGIGRNPIPKQEPASARPVNPVSVAATALPTESNSVVLIAPSLAITPNLPPPDPRSPLAAASLPKSPLQIQLPIPAFMGTPTDIPLDEHIEKPSDKPRPPFLAPQGCTNVALHKKVTSSDLNPISGSLDLTTDGDKESSDTSFVELHRKTQWVQIDLETPCAIYAVVIWHAHNTPQIYKDVIVQLADDPDFTANVRTVFNNDWDNSSGLGAGHNQEYFENFEGKLIDTQGQPARYLRLYSKGSTFSALNRYTEVEAYGLPLTP
jgi:hypothetical protein